jgi:aminoglycoside phosphotransferase (APT) family kinase protein
MSSVPDITQSLVQQLIREQFPEFSELSIQPVKVQGHDNRSFRLGEAMLIRMPTGEAYALKVPKEQKLLPQIAPHLTVAIPVPLKLGRPSNAYPFNFSIYQWLDGESANQIQIDPNNKEQIALALATFLKELQGIDTKEGPAPGQHNWWRGDHVSVYDQQARRQIATLKDIIDSHKALALWENALSSRWCKNPVWIHGDLAIGNILINEGTLSGIIDFGGIGIGDPACDLVISWTFLEGRSREIFHDCMELDTDTWTRARGWALWKATFELCNRIDKNDTASVIQKRIIEDVLNEPSLR